MEITEVNNDEFEGSISILIITRGVNRIEIPHERTRAPNEPLTEDEQPIFRSELGKLMRIAWVARPGRCFGRRANVFGR